MSTGDIKHWSLHKTGFRSVEQVKACEKKTKEMLFQGT